MENKKDQKWEAARESIKNQARLLVGNIFPAAIEKMKSSPLPEETSSLFKSCQQIVISEEVEQDVFDESLDPENRYLIKRTQKILAEAKIGVISEISNGLIDKKLLNNLSEQTIDFEAYLWARAIEIIKNSYNQIKTEPAIDKACWQLVCNEETTSKARKEKYLLLRAKDLRLTPSLKNESVSCEQNEASQARPEINANSTENEKKEQADYSKRISRPIEKNHIENNDSLPSDLIEMSNNFRNLMKSFIYLILLGALFSVIPVVGTLVILFLEARTLFYTYKTCVSVEISGLETFIYLLLQLIPIIFLIPLLLLQKKVKAAVEEYGIKMGFLGPVIK